MSKWSKALSAALLSRAAARFAVLATRGEARADKDRILDQVELKYKLVRLLYLLNHRHKS
jgi:hypothetical protein